MTLDARQDRLICHIFGHRHTHYNNCEGMKPLRLIGLFLLDKADFWITPIPLGFPCSTIRLLASILCPRRACVSSFSNLSQDH